MADKPAIPELLEARRFHGHLGPYLVVGMRMGALFCQEFGDKPFSYRIHVTVGFEPPPSCVIDGLQISTPCTVGNSMIRIENSGEVKARAAKGGRSLELRLNQEVRRRIDLEATAENEESFAREIWEMPAEKLFDMCKSPI